MRRIRFYFEILESAPDQWTVRFRGEQGDPITESFICGLEEGSLLALKIDKVANSVAQTEDLRFIGAALLQALLPGQIENEYHASCVRAEEQTQFQIRLNLPASLQNLPWECLYHRDDGFLATHDRYSICREPLVDPTFPHPTIQSKRPLSLLVVVPDGSGLQVDNECANLKRIVSGLTPAGEMEKLHGRVTPDSLAKKLETQRYDIVHYIGHGDIVKDGLVSIRLLDDDGQEVWVAADEFASAFRSSKVRLVVLNCCLAAAASPHHSLSGAAPFLTQRQVPAVVAMRYEITNEAAVCFSRWFYEALFGDKCDGRVDLAVDEARSALFRNAQQTGIRSFVTPVLYIKEGFEKLFETRRAQTSVVLSPSPPSTTLPPGLAKSLREKRCIPVIGPGILATGLARSGTPPPGPMELARRLAADPECLYPDTDDLEICLQAGEWMQNLALQWVCQHYQREQHFGDLLERLKTQYPVIACPDSIREIANWCVPAIFYTHFDGFLQDVTESAIGGPPTTVLQRPDDKPPFEGRQTGPFPRLLVLVRGTVRNEDSLVLTEDDHEQLGTRLAKMDPKVLDIVRGRPKRCVLFLGLHPRDHLAHQLAQCLLESGPRRKQDITYFACANPTAADNAYWSKYQVCWLDGSLLGLLNGISELTKGVA